MDYFDSPDYLKSADLHNTASGNKSFFDDPAGAVGDAIIGTANFIAKTPVFAVASIASGANSIYNSGVAAGNWLGVTDAKENDLQKTLNSFDSDLGKYYGAHKEAVDLGGFLVGSFVPGTAGVKLLNVGQRMLGGAMKTGSVAATLAESTGLVLTAGKDGKTLAAVAGEALAQGNQVFSWTNTNVIRAVAAGVGQAALDGVAFEAMVQATMFRSPILEHQDFKDIGYNILTGAVLGGAIGGAFNAAGVYGTVVKKIGEEDFIRKPFTTLTSTANVRESDKIVLRAADIDFIPQTTEPRLLQMATKKIEAARNDIRSAVMTMGKDDKEIAGMVADTFDGVSGDQIANMIGGATGFKRVGGKLVAGLDEQVGFVKMHGVNGVGDVTFDTIDNGALNLTTRLAAVRPGQIKTVVENFVNKQGFNEAKIWSPLKAATLDEIEARYIWAQKNAIYKNGMTIHEHDIPLLEGAMQRNLPDVTLVSENGTRYLSSADDIANTIVATKFEVSEALALVRPTGWEGGVRPTAKSAVITSDELARAVNVDVRFIENESTASYMARQDAQALSDKTRLAAGKASVDLDYLPQHIGVVYDSTRAAKINTDLTSTLVNVRAQQKIIQQKVDVAFAQLTGEMEGRFPASFLPHVSEASRKGAGASLLASANSDPGTLGSIVEYIGKSTSDLTQKLKTNTDNIVGSVSLRLRQDQAAAIEFSAINDLRNQTTVKYVINDDETGLIAADIYKWRKKVAETGDKNTPAPELQAGAPAEIIFKNPLAGEAVIADMQANGYRVGHENALRKAEGAEGTKDPSAFYGWRPNPQDMKFFAFVKDETIRGQAAGHTTMIHARDADYLEQMIEKINAKGGYKVYTKDQTEAFYKARKEYEFDRTLHDNYIDSSLKSNGINSQFNPKTDPEAIVNEWLAHHSRKDTLLARDAVSTKYANEFAELSSMGDQFKGVASSAYKLTSSMVERTTKNPYNDYIKTALNISKMEEYPTLFNINDTLSKAVNGTVQKIIDTYETVKTTADLPRINQMLKEAGINHAYGDAAELMLANHSAPKAYLANFVRSANSILAATFLRLDFLNPIVNAVSAQVLLGHETNKQTKALLRDINKAGVIVPGTEDTILSPFKLIAAANADFISGNPEMKQLLSYHGITSKYDDQMREMLDHLSLQGAENVPQMSTKLAKALEISKELTRVGGKVTGNDFAEYYNRYVAGHVAHQIAGARIEAGLMNADTLPSFVNTFVNRTQTNTLASQRPLLFQGPIGQAIGLFQSFQFNTMQQLFKGVAEGGAKDAAMMMGLQGTMFGLNGLPAFQAINQHIIGTASGNKDHVDAYSALYGAAGKTAGDWLMYGIPSNLLQTNLYSRGDINPRQLTVVPVNPADIVAVSAFGKFAGNIKETLTKMVSGGDVWQTFLQGLEHNGLNRPLQGLAQTLQATGPAGKVFSTTGKGDIGFVNDFMSLATLSRLAGGKPLDEALANDEVARSMVYKAADRARIKADTEVFRSHVVGDTNGYVTPAAVNNYLVNYVHHGGDAETFNKNMLHVMTQVNTPKANQIIAALKGPYAERMKELMPGRLEGLDD